MSGPAGEKSDFEFSRIYGRGWNTARKLIAAGKAPLDARQVESLNPYVAPEERARWAKGFAEALKSPPRRVTKMDTKLRRPATGRDAE